MPLRSGENGNAAWLGLPRQREVTRMRFWFASIVAVLLAGGASAQTVERVDISNAGIYRVEKGTVEDAPTTALGRFNVVRDQTLVERTQRIPGRLEVNMGMNFEIVGQPIGELVTVRYVTHFPPPGLRDPKTGRVHLKSEVERQHRIGQLAFRSYSFDEPWEIVTGTWTLEFWYGAKMLGSQKFEVVKAKELPSRDAGPAADTPSR